MAEQPLITQKKWNAKLRELRVAKEESASLRKLLEASRAATLAQVEGVNGLMVKLEAERIAHDDLKRSILDGSHPNLVLERNALKAEQSRRVEDLRAVFDNLPYLENLILPVGHESGLMRDHPWPCTGHDFCLMRQAQKGADAIRAAFPEIDGVRK